MTCANIFCYSAASGKQPSTIKNYIDAILKFFEYLSSEWNWAVVEFSNVERKMTKMKTALQRQFSAGRAERQKKVKRICPTVIQLWVGVCLVVCMDFALPNFAESKRDIYIYIDLLCIIL